MKKQFIRPQVKAIYKYQVVSGNANQSSPVLCSKLPNQNGPATCTSY